MNRVVRPGTTDVEVVKMFRPDEGMVYGRVCVSSVVEIREHTVSPANDIMMVVRLGRRAYM